jgi:saccharopine dehydrogenase-like NADP-dependent oxidoreductase
VIAVKVLVMGGAGDMGSKTVEDLAAKAGVERVTIGDRNLAAAEGLAGRLAGSPAEVTALAVDAMDHHGMVEAMTGNDVVASALGPFFLFETRLVKAALEAGVDYISICDDWCAAQDTIIRFDGPARDKGRMVITGCGVSPGMSNVAVRYLAGQLDRARRADVLVYMPMDSGEGEAVTQHTLFIFGTVVPVFRDGAVIMLPAGSLSRTVEFPRFGLLKVWNIGHGEPVTVPRHVPELDEVNIMLGMGRGTEIVVALGRLGAFSTPRRIEKMARLLMKLFPSKPGPASDGAMRIDVSGEKDGRTTTVTLCGTGTMREATGIALSIGAQLLAGKLLTVQQGGVYGPEGCFVPEDFLRMMAESGFIAYSDLTMLDRIN